MTDPFHVDGNSSFPTSKTPGPVGRAPRSKPEWVVLLGRIGRLLLLYVRGQMLMSLIIGGLIAVVGLALGLEGAILWGMLAGALETIPQFGSIIALIPALVSALYYGSSILPVQNWVFALIVVAAYFVVQQIGSLLISPRLLGKSLNLPPILVLLAVILGAALLNIVGAYLAVPALVVAREVGRYVVRKAKGQPPFEDVSPVPTETPPPPA